MNIMGKPPLGLKEGRPKNGTAAGRAHMNRVKQLPCVCCHRPPPSDAHHCFHGRYGSGKSSDFAVIPLCRQCHQEGPDSIHQNKNGWRELNGSDFDYIPVVADMLAGEWTPYD